MEHVRRVRVEWQTQTSKWERVERRDEGAESTSEMTGDEWRLTKVYVSTNGDEAWWEAITSELRADGWEVRGSKDMDFVRDGEGVWEGSQVRRRKSERIVGLAVDMEIAARAEVFIGNGVRTSTLTCLFVVMMSCGVFLHSSFRCLLLSLLFWLLHC